MSTVKILGIVLIVAGILDLAYGGFTYTKETHDIKLGSLEMSIKDKRRSTSRSGQASERSWPADCFWSSATREDKDCNRADSLLRRHWPTTLAWRGMIKR